jgi:hypothetical protein
MHIEKIYLQENYRRHPGDDPFLFGTVGVGVHINEGESVDEAIQMAKNQLITYIKENTHYPEHNHVEVRDVQVEKKTPEQERLDALLRDIWLCKDVTELESYRLLTNGNAVLKHNFNTKLKQLTQCTTSATPLSDAVH